MREVWEDGQAFKDLDARFLVLTAQKEGIEAARKVPSFDLKIAQIRPS